MDEVFDPIFGCFVPVFPSLYQSELSEEELDALAEKADLYYQYLAFG